MNKAIFIIGAVGIAAGVVGTILSYVYTTPAGSQQTACTMEARLCPDGSGVGRQGPNCEFAACPPVSVALNETVTFGATDVTPLRVVEDSRCPEDAQCVWEGTFTVEVEVAENDRTQTSVMGPGDVIDTTFGPVVLSSVEPPASTDGPVAASAYRFVFTEEQ